MQIDDDTTAPAPSRPQRNPRPDGDATRARIIEAAGELFGDLGFAETTSKAIAARAEVDIASINYHFTNRDGLYESVLAEAHRRLVSIEELDAIIRSNEPAAMRLRRLIELIVARSMGKRGWNAHVLARELLSPTSHLDVLFEDEMPPKFHRVTALFAEITGMPPNDPALVRCAVSTGAPCAVLFLMERIPNPLVNQLLQMSHETLVDHLHTFAMGGLEAIRRQSGR